MLTVVDSQIIVRGNLSLGFPLDILLVFLLKDSVRCLSRTRRNDDQYEESKLIGKARTDDDDVCLLGVRRIEGVGEHVLSSARPVED